MAIPQKSILVAVVGAGLVGSEFISQLLSLQQPSPFKIVSISSSKKTIFTSDLSKPFTADWKNLLTNSPEGADLQKLTQRLKDLVKPAEQDVVVIDNTSNEDVAGLYPTWLRAGISVITPNKKAYSGEQKLFDDIVSAAAESGAKFLNESTVGAGLPTISTLKDLVATGDKIHKIEGVFSGTMSYIFNNFSPASSSSSSLPSFSSVVKVAKEQGYTEPHPADDLNGFDVARKLVILSRFSGSQNLASKLPKGYLSVNTRSLIPGPLEGLQSGEEFVSRLGEFDSEFDKLREEARKEGKILRYVGVVDPINGEVKASLESYPTSHPLASLSGSDNIFLFYTERYPERPLIIQGSGAGAAVTAMGVLADLLKLKV